MTQWKIGRESAFLLEEKKNRGMELELLKPEPEELGHMACRMEEKPLFLYVKKGKLTCQINQDTVQIEEGEGVFINKKNAYRFLKGSHRPGVFVLWKISEQVFENGGEDMLVERYVKPVADPLVFPWYLLERGKEKEMLQILQEAVTLAEKKEPGFELLLRGLALYLWGRLYRIFEQKKGELARTSGREQQKLTGMIAFLHEHYQERLTLEQMAENSGVSKGEYCRFFKKHMRQTPVEYLQQYRIQQSLSQLVENKSSITELSLLHGFRGSSYYAETFKKEMGCAPGDYRKWYQTGGVCPLQTKEDTEEKKEKIRHQEKMPAHLL